MASHDLLLAIDGDSNERDTKVALEEIIEVSFALKDPHKAFLNLFAHIHGWSSSDVCLRAFLFIQVL
jgi:hypothetical protein